MKKKILSASIACALIMGVCTGHYIITDTSPQGEVFASGSSSQVETLVEKGIMQGDENGNLNIDKTVTRAEFSKMLMLAAEKCGITLDTVGGKAFSDVPRTHWAYSYVSTMAANGIISGFEDGLFRPDEVITYEQAAKMAVTLFGISCSSDKYPTGYIAAVISEGINDGVEALTGQALTRSDAASIIANSMDYVSSDIEGTRDRYSGGVVSLMGIGSVNKAMSASGAVNSVQSAPMASQTESVMMDSAEYGVMPMPMPPVYVGEFNTESYTQQAENVFKDTLTSPLSTFSIDTDTASYSNLRRFITQGQKIAAGSIRTEELINYFDYDYALPTDGTPFSVTTETAVCPWNENNMLAMVAIQGDELHERKPSNITFLIDTSGSMYSKNKLPLVKRSMNILLEKLEPTDTVSIVTYAGGVSKVLEGEKAENKEKIKKALDSLHAGGGTAGADGLNLAYEVAEKNKIDGNNRIILCTDGDFNIGPSSDAEMTRLIEEKREKGIFISVLGFGMHNYKDSKMELIADKGNGSYAYIDNIREAKKVLADDMTKTLFTIAKDVKIQVEFNPEKVAQYRLIGYENRKLNNEDFDNDAKDAGELGAGASVTALYEIVPTDGAKQSELHFSTVTTNGSDDMMYVKLRYKEPDGTESKLIEKAVSAQVGEMSESMKFASSVAQLGMLLNNSEYKGTATLDSVYNSASESLGEDEYGLRHEFLQMVDLLRYKTQYEDISVNDIYFDDDIYIYD